MSKNKSPKLVRSGKLRKYSSVYNSYIRKIEQLKLDKSPRKERSISLKHSEILKKSKDKSKKKKLNEYQKFVKNESKKDKYKNIPSVLRLSAIANEWKKIKNPEKKN